MQTPQRIKHHLRQVVFRHRKRFIENGLKRRPCNCKFNALVKIPQKANRETLRVCLYGVDREDGWNNVTCDEAMGGVEQAQECALFQCKNKAEDLKAMFNSQLGLDGTPVETGWIAQHYPDVVALTWALGDSPKAKTVAEREVRDHVEPDGEENGLDE